MQNFTLKHFFFHDHTYPFRNQCHFESWHEILEFAKHRAHWECLVRLINKAKSHLNRSLKKSSLETRQVKTKPEKIAPMRSIWLQLDVKSIKDERLQTKSSSHWKKGSVRVSYDHICNCKQTCFTNRLVS